MFYLDAGGAQFFQRGSHHALTAGRGRSGPWVFHQRYAAHCGCGLRQFLQVVTRL
jgi:hypothetical protein